MKHGIATLSIIPVRKDPSETCEMVTQLLFGELFEILKGNNKWQYIRTLQDDYLGWIDAKMSTVLDKRHFNRIIKNKPFISNDLFSTITDQGNSRQTIVAGSSIHGYNGKKSFRFNNISYRVLNNFSHPGQHDARSLITSNALKFLNSPYLWGGRSPVGIDCSGFTQIVYKMSGLNIPRDASQQVRHGVAVDFVNEAHPGDLAFFDNADGVIIHTGIILDQGRIIHASGKVRIDMIDHEGINHSGTRRYTHQLRVVKNIIDHADTRS